jgi:hypothetical protein
MPNKRATSVKHKRNTHKKGGTLSKNKSKTHKNQSPVSYKTVVESLAKQKIPEQVIGKKQAIGENIMSFLNNYEQDKATKVMGMTEYGNIQDFFQPTITYHFVCDVLSYEDDRWSDPRNRNRYLELKNTTFDNKNNIKERMDACVKDDAIQYLISKYGDYLDKTPENAKNVEPLVSNPTIDVTLVLRIRENKEGQAVRMPFKDTPIIINKHHTNAHHTVAVYSSYGAENSEEDYGVLLKTCKKLYAHIEGKKGRF